MAGETPRTFVVHGLEPMTLKELAAIPCGHCYHRLTLHITSEETGSTRCAVCGCFRLASEDIREPHRFVDVSE